MSIAMTAASIGVRALERSEVDAAASMLAAAFEDDPLFRCLLPDRDARAHWLRVFHTVTIRSALAAGGAHVVGTGPRTGAIGIFPPGAWPRPFGSLLWTMPWPRRLPPYRFVAGSWRMGRRLKKRHPTVPYVYACVIGVHPSEQGGGLGGALLRHALAEADGRGVPMFLETGNPANIPLYRRFGFHIDEEIQVGRLPPMWTMIRPRTVPLATATATATAQAGAPPPPPHTIS